MRPDDPRRKALMVAGMVGCILFNWWLFRVSPKRDQLKALETDLAALEAAPRSSPFQVEALTAQLAQVREELASAGGESAPTPSSDRAVEVAALAQSVGLRVESAQAVAPTQAFPPSTPNATPSGRGPAALAAGLAKSDPSRSLVRWTARGEFSGLLAFLEQLPPGVMVIELGLERSAPSVAPPTGEGLSPLPVEARGSLAVRLLLAL